MKHRHTEKIKLAVGLVIVVLILLTGCAARKNFWGDPSTGLILQYRMDDGQTVKYSFSEKAIQSMDMMGQTIEVESEKGVLFSMQAEGFKENQNQLNVTVDSMSVNSVSMQGDISGDMSNVIGKSFSMSLSSLGKEADFSGIEAIKYTLGPQGERGISADFETFFPNLAGIPLKTGETWTSKDTMHINEGGMELILFFDYENTLAGFETLQGFECAKITSKYTGTLTGEGSQMGADLTFEGDMEGTDTWYFAYKKGILIQTDVQGFTESTIAVTGPQNMTIPMTMDITVKVRHVQ